jgi:hypothetical protein
MRFTPWRRWLKRAFGTHRRVPVRRRPVLPRFESLEARWVPSFSSVTGFTITPFEMSVFDNAVASFTSPDAGPFSASIDWGDGTVTSGTISSLNGNFLVNGTHTWAEDGTVPVTVALSDAFDSSTATAHSRAIVQESGFAGVFALPINATEGQSSTFTVATITDPGSPDPASAFSATIDWGDGTSSAGTITGSDDNFTVTGTHTYADELNGFTQVFSNEAGGVLLLAAGNTVHVADADTLTPTFVTTGDILENEVVQGTAAVWSDAGYPNNNPADFSGTFDWGDGTTYTTAAGNAFITSDGAGNFTLSVAGHKYLDEGIYTVHATLTDNAPGTDTSTQTGFFTVQETDTLVPAAVQPGVVLTEGIGTVSRNVAVFSHTGYPNNVAADFTAAIDWGDGTTSAGTVGTDGDGNFTVSGSHAYADEGTFTVTTTIADDAPGTATATATTTATAVENDTLAGSLTGVAPTEGSSFTGSVATFTDTFAGNTAGDFTASIDWGDGSTTTGTVTGGGGSFTVSGTHAFADEGSFTITVLLSDDAPGTAVGTATGSVTVAEADVLSATALPVGATEGTSFSGTVATFTDTNAANTAADFTATILWGDGTTTTGVVASTGGTFTVSGTHTYVDEGSFTVTAVLMDDTPGTASATATGTAAVAEADTLSGTLTAAGATEGTSFSGAVATFTDTDVASTAADFTAAINWGDGTSSTGTVTGSGGKFTVSGTHTYAGEGPFTVSAVLTDDAPGTSTGTVSGTLTVAEGDVLSGTGVPVSPTEGTSFNGAVATFTNTDTANTAADFTATIHWGDGTTGAGTVTGAGGTFTVSGTHTYADDGPFTVTAVLADDAPGTATATATGTATVAEADVLSGSATPIQTVEGTPVGVVATFTDAFTGNPASDLTATIDWGDGTTTAGTISGGNGSFTVTGSHTYTASGSFTVAVTLADDAPGTATATATTTASVSGDVVVQGTSGDDVLTLFRTPGGVVGSITYVLNGGPPVSLTGVHSFRFNGLGGNDTMIVQFGNGGPLLNGLVSFDGGVGSNTLVVDAAGRAVCTRPNEIRVNETQSVTYGNVETTDLNNAAAVDAFAGPDTADRATAFAGLNAQERFVQALYLDEMGRPGSKAELDAWVGVLGGPGQFSVALAIDHSAEARDHLVKSWYLAFLGRAAAGGEEQGFVNLLLSGQTEEQVLGLILSSPEFHARARTLVSSGSADARFVQSLYLLLLNRTASDAEIAGWVNVLPLVGEQGVAQSILGSSEFRADEFEGYYNVQLHRPADSTGLNIWVESGLDVGTVRTFVESSSEFFSNS